MLLSNMDMKLQEETDYISSQYAPVDNFKDKRIFFSGNITSCRNIGNLIFFILEDESGSIQAVLKNSPIEKKTIKFLIGKKLHLVGTIRTREQEVKSKSKVNNNIEIEIENCSLIKEDRTKVSISSNSFKLNPILVEPAHSNQFFQRGEHHEKTLFFSKLLQSLREYLINKEFIEIDSKFFQRRNRERRCQQELGELEAKCKHGFNRHFHFNKELQSLQIKTLELCLGFNVSNVEHLRSTINDLINHIRKFEENPSLAPIPLIKKSQSFSTYGTPQPDLRYPFEIQDFTTFFQNIYHKEMEGKFVHCITLPLSRMRSLHSDEIKRMIMDQFGIHLSSLMITRKGVSGSLAKSLCNEEVGNLISFLNADSDSLTFFSLSSSEIQNQIALGAVIGCLKEIEGLENEASKACWVEDEEKISSFILNGQHVGLTTISTYIESEPNGHAEPFNIGMAIIDLLSFEKNSKSNCFIEKTDRQIIKGSNSPKIYAQEATSEEIEAEKKAQLKIESNQILAFFDSMSGEKEESRMQRILKTFDMDIDDALKIINLIPGKIDEIEKLPHDQKFSLFWSILGNKNSRVLLRDQATCEKMSNLVDLEILTDHKQLLLFSGDSVLRAYDFLIGHKKIEFDTKKKLIKTLLHSAPNNFINLINRLHEWIESTSIDQESIEPLFLRAARLRFTTPVLFRYFMTNHQDQSAINELISKLKSFDVYFFRNDKILSGDLLAQTFIPNMDQKISLMEVLYYLFNPINLDYDSFSELIIKVPDCTDHIKNMGLFFSGDHWNFLESHYYFKNDEKANHIKNICIYPSKNMASFLAKASCGICTFSDISLYTRTDHFHLNLVIPEEARVVGNVQAYQLSRANRRSLLLRGINPSASIIDDDNIYFILNSIISAAIQIAEGSEIDELLLCPSLGIWHVESSRMELIAALAIFCKSLSSVKLDAPFHLFSFANQVKCINSAFLLWERKAK